MIGLTKKCQYALRALYILAREYGNGPIMIPQLSAEANAPPEFLQGILLELKNAGILESRRGTRGGYGLLIPPGQVTVGSIISFIDGPLVALPRAGHYDSHPCVDCSEGHACHTCRLLREVQQALTAILDGSTLEAACKPQNSPTGA